MICKSFLERIAASVEQEKAGMFSVATMLLMLAIMVIIKPYEPPDDLLRHLISYLHNYDYRKMYLYSDFPPFNMYAGFDWLVGQAHAAFGYYSYILVQVVNVLLFSLIYLYLLRDVEPNLRAAVLLVALIAVLPRLLLGRPSSFEGSLMLLGFAMARDSRVPWWGHACVGSIMVPLYYLFPIYVIPLVLVKRIYLLVLAAGLLWWHMMSGGAYWETAISVLKSGSVGRFTEIDELKSALPSMFQVLFAVIPAVLYFKKDKITGLASLWFLLPNQVRYLETAVPLMLSMARHMAFRPSVWVILSLFGVLLSTQVGLSAKSSVTKAVLLKDAFAPGDRVYAAAMTMGVQYANPYILMAPGFEPEWLMPPLRESFVKTVKTGVFDCSTISKYPFDYVVESHLREKPACLDLYKIAGVYRVWTVKPGVF